MLHNGIFFKPVKKVVNGGGPGGREDSATCVCDVVYDEDHTEGQVVPDAGDAAAARALTELAVPRSRITSREVGGDVFPGAAVKVHVLVGVDSLAR
jgi:hypothetical protein